MNRHRCVTSMPGVSISTMNAVIPPRFFPARRRRLAMTTITPAFTPFVHQSFSPLSRIIRAVLRGLRLRLHLCRVGPDLRLGKRECGDFPARHSRQKTPLLLLCPEQDERLRHPDGLMRGEQRRQVPAITPEQHPGAAIILCESPRPPYSVAILIPNAPIFASPSITPSGISPGPVDLVRVHMLGEKIPQPRQEGVALVPVFIRLARVTAALLHLAPPHEEPAHEAPLGVRCLARPFAQLERRSLASGHF